MSSDWNDLALGDVAEIVGGGTPSTSNSEYYGGDVPWITPKDLSGYLFKRISRGERMITRTGQKSSSTKMLPKDSVLLTSRAPIGYVAIAEVPLCTNQGFKSLVLKPGHHPDFYFYLLKHNKDKIESHSSGSTFKEISGSVLKSLRFNIPSFSEQKRIAEVLGSLDDKIELNRRMNATLEATARALFQSWFVDFDPIRAKLDGRTPTGMDAATASLFPDSFEESSIGNIPKGWEVRTIESICGTVTRGVTPEYEEGSKRFIINQRVNRGTDLDWTSLKEISSKLEVPEDRYAKKWDVLVNCLGEGTLGRVHLFKGESNLYAVDQHMSICRGEHPSVGVFLYQVLSAPTGQDKIESLKTGSTGMTMFNISKLRTFDLIWPGATLVRSYFDAVQPLWLQIALNEKQSRILATLRDTLLPKLLSGELSVKEAA